MNTREKAALESAHATHEVSLVLANNSKLYKQALASALRYQEHLTTLATCLRVIAIEALHMKGERLSRESIMGCNYMALAREWVEVARCRAADEQQNRTA